MQLLMALLQQLPTQQPQQPGNDTEPSTAQKRRQPTSTTITTAAAASLDGAEQGTSRAGGRTVGGTASCSTAAADGGVPTTVVVPRTLRRIREEEVPREFATASKARHATNDGGSGCRSGKTSVLCACPMCCTSSGLLGGVPSCECKRCPQSARRGNRPTMMPVPACMVAASGCQYLMHTLSLSFGMVLLYKITAFQGADSLCQVAQMDRLCLSGLLLKHPCCSCRSGCDMSAVPSRSSIFFWP